MKNAVYSPNFGSFGCVNKLVELAVLAENSGFDGFFLWDHINITGNEMWSKRSFPPPARLRPYIKLIKSLL